MKKSVLIMLSVLWIGFLNAKPVTVSEDEPVKIENLDQKINRLKIELIKIQLKHQNKGLKHSVKLLKELSEKIKEKK